MKRISESQLNELLQELNEIRPFKTYLHGCSVEAATNIIEKGQHFGGMNENSDATMRRSSISSTVVYGGTANDAVLDLLHDYKHAGSTKTLIMIMPNAISVDNYAGAIEGQNDIGTNNNNHIYLDYSIIGYNKAVTQDKDIIAPKNRLDGVHNSLFLGYYDRETNEFVLNENCVLLSENNRLYEELISNSKKIANINYQDRLLNRLTRNGEIHSQTEAVKRYYIENNIPTTAINDFAKELYENSKEFELDNNLEPGKLLVRTTTPSHIDTAMSNIMNMLPDDIENRSPEEQADINWKISLDIQPAQPKLSLDDLIAKLQDLESMSISKEDSTPTEDLTV